MLKLRRLPRRRIPHPQVPKDLLSRRLPRALSPSLPHSASLRANSKQNRMGLWHGRSPRRSTWVATPNAQRRCGRGEPKSPRTDSRCRGNDISPAGPPHPTRRTDCPQYPVTDTWLCLHRQPHASLRSFKPAAPRPSRPSRTAPGTGTGTVSAYQISRPVPSNPLLKKKFPEASKLPKKFQWPPS
jgi:hypothetical protein